MSVWRSARQPQISREQRAGSAGAGAARTACGGALAAGSAGGARLFLRRYGATAGKAARSLLQPCAAWSRAADTAAVARRGIPGRCGPARNGCASAAAAESPARLPAPCGPLRPRRPPPRRVLRAMLPCGASLRARSAHLSRAHKAVGRVRSYSPALRAARGVVLPRARRCRCAAPRVAVAVASPLRMCLCWATQQLPHRRCAAAARRLAWPPLLALRAPLPTRPPRCPRRPRLPPPRRCAGGALPPPPQPPPCPSPRRRLW